MKKIKEKKKERNNNSSDNKKNKSQKTSRVPNYIYDKNSNNNRRSLSKNFSPQEKEFIKNPNKKIGGQGTFRPNIINILEQKNNEFKKKENNSENNNISNNNIKNNSIKNNNDIKNKKIDEEITNDNNKLYEIYKEKNNNIEKKKKFSTPMSVKHYLPNNFKEISRSPKIEKEKLKEYKERAFKNINNNLLEITDEPLLNDNYMTPSNKYINNENLLFDVNTDNNMKHINSAFTVSNNKEFEFEPKELEENGNIFSLNKPNVRGYRSNSVFIPNINPSNKKSSSKFKENNHLNPFEYFNESIEKEQNVKKTKKKNDIKLKVEDLDDNKSKKSESEYSISSSQSSSSSSQSDSESNEYDNFRDKKDNDSMIKINIDNNLKNNKSDNYNKDTNLNEDYEKKINENIKNNITTSTPKGNRKNLNQENTFRHGSISKSIDKNISIKSPKNSLIVNAKNQNNDKIMLSPNDEYYNNLKKNFKTTKGIHRSIKSMRNSKNFKIIEQIKKEKKEEINRRNSFNSQRRNSGNNISKDSKTQESFNNNLHNNTLNNNNKGNQFNINYENSNKKGFKKSKSKPIFNKNNSITPQKKKNENIPHKNILKTSSNMKHINQNYKKIIDSLKNDKIKNQNKKYIQSHNLMSDDNNLNNNMYDNNIYHNNNNNSNNINNNNKSNNCSNENNNENNFYNTNNNYNNNDDVNNNNLDGNNITNKEDDNEESYLLLREKFIEFLKKNSNGNLPNHTTEEKNLDEKVLRNLAKNEIPIENDNLDNIKCTNDMREFLTESLNNFKLLRMKERVYEIQGDKINTQKFEPTRSSLLGLIHLDYENENVNKGNDNILEPMELERSSINLNIRKSFIDSFKYSTQTILPSVEQNEIAKRASLFK